MGICLYAGKNTFSNQTVNLLVNNYNLTLDCGSTINYHENHSHIKWIQENKIVYPSHHYIIIKSSLVIINLTVADAGHYQCRVFNSVQRRIDTNTIQIIIKGMYVAT